VTTKEILVPDIGDFQNVEIIEVLVAAGESIALDDPLITLESDKASMEVPSTDPGTVKQVKVKVGDKVSEGDLIMLLDVAVGEEASEAEAHAPRKTSPAPPTQDTLAAPAVAVVSAAVPAAGISFERVHASPSVRRIARERRINLNQIKGTGRKGRVTKQDLGRFKEAAVAPATAEVASAIPPIPAVDFAKFGEIEAQPLSKIKRLTGINLSRAWLNVPHVTHHDEADITELEAFRQALKPRAEKTGVRVTLLSFFMKACAATLQAFPSFNASLDPSGEHLIIKKYYHIGIAVDTPNGLVVPVIRDVDKKGLFELSAELAEMSGKARAKKLTPGDMQGGTFTISSLGGIGGTAFTPIVNAPEVAILGLTRSQHKPIPQGDGFAFRLMQPMSLSYDHRVIDGAQAARFVRQLGELVNDIRLLLT
jgi:pyruvate dehydrogenase E2 component (dihydrolipoamide acetyltransferase)